MRASRPRLADIWSANQYLVYSALRDRPFHELRARALPDADAAPRMVVDLGCGTGHLTSTLCRPGMDRVVGVDSSADMLAKAPRDVAGLSFERGDLTTWAPRHGPLDCVFSNAALHWVTPDATTQLFAKWRGWLCWQHTFGRARVLTCVAPLGRVAQARRSAGFPGSRQRAARPVAPAPGATAQRSRVAAARGRW